MALREYTMFRDRLRVFEDRRDAGRLLGEMLVEYRDAGAIVLALPSGGVPVGVEVAKALNAALDLLIVRKIQIPDNPEAGFGAISPDGTPIINEGLLAKLSLSKKAVESQINKAIESVKQRDNLFRKNRPYASFQSKNIIVVDDGLASGFTMLAAIRFVKRDNPQKVIVAVPTSSARAIDFILAEVDELFCANIRTGYSFAVAEAYRNWYDLTEEEVIVECKRFQPGDVMR
ncbi:MAG: phosphoribosyltransferase family protein [Thermodesulfovibrionales bacterium]